MTQSKLATAIGLSRVSISNIEKGRQNFLVHSLWEIARTLKVSPAELFPKPINTKQQRAQTSSLLSYTKLPAKERAFVGAVLRDANVLDVSGEKS